MALEGDLKDFSILDLINLVVMSKKKGALIFRPKAGDEWRIYFDEGKVKHVIHDDKEGEKVLERLVTLKEGPFLFDTSKTTEQTSIFRSHEDLIYHLSTLLKTWEEIKGILPPPDVKLEVDTSFEEIVLSNAELRMLLLVHSKGYLREIMGKEQDVGIKELQTLPNLIRAGLVKVSTTTASTNQQTVAPQVSEVKKEVETPKPKEDNFIKLTAVKSFSIGPEVVQIDNNALNTWAEKKLFTGKVIIKNSTFIVEPKPKLGKAIIISEKTMKSLGLKDGEEVEVSPY